MISGTFKLYTNRNQLYHRVNTNENKLKHLIHSWQTEISQKGKPTHFIVLLKLSGLQGSSTSGRVCWVRPLDPRAHVRQLRLCGFTQSSPGFPSTSISQRRQWNSILKPWPLLLEGIFIVHFCVILSIVYIWVGIWAADWQMITFVL